MIVRVADRKRYTVIDNQAIEDARLSWRALGLLAYLLSRPDNWEANYRHLASLRGDGQHSIRSVLKELEEMGYIERRRERDASGKFQWVQVIYENSRVAPCGDSPRMVAQRAVDHAMVDQRAVEGAEGKTEDPIPDVPSTETKAEAERLCELLAERMEANGCKRPTITKTWVDDMDRMLRLDGREPEKVANCIRWSQSDPFWRGNILSPAKLRKQYDQLRLAAMRAPRGGSRGAERDRRQDLLFDAIRDNEQEAQPG